MQSTVSYSFWKDKRVLVTGHTGFKGSWLSLWLAQMGAQVSGFSLPPRDVDLAFDACGLSEVVTSFYGDINDKDMLEALVSDFQPQVIFHLAAQPLVRSSYEDPYGTFQTNVMGTLCLFEASLKSQALRVIVNITTDKCYENMEWDWGYRETDRLGGHDPYSASKACVELLSQSFRRSYLEGNGATVKLVTARAGNVIGGGDWSQDRLIPDMVKSYRDSKTVLLRNPGAIRPWQHVLEPISGYMQLAQYICRNVGDLYPSWNFGPELHEAHSVGDVASIFMTALGNETPYEVDIGSNPHEAKLLLLDISRAKSVLGWKPAMSTELAIQKTAQWYKAWMDGEDMHRYTIEQIDSYLNLISGG